MEQKDLYKTLEIAKTATAEEIKKAGAKAKILNHPDKVRKINAGLDDAAMKQKLEEANARLQEADEAIAILSDEKLRQIYDARGYAAAVTARKPVAQKPGGGPAPQSPAAAPIPTITREDMAAEYRKWNAGSDSEKSQQPIIINSTVDAGKESRLARFKGGGAATPPAQQPQKVTVIQRETPVQPQKTPAPAAQSPIDRIVENAEALKGSFNYVSVPVEALERIRDHLEAALTEVNISIKTAKGFNK